MLAPAPLGVSIAVATNQAVSTASHSVNVYSLSVTSDIVTFDINGHARISDGQIDEVLNGSTQFCTNKETKCAKCPTQTGSDMRLIEKDIDLALSAGSTATSGTVKGTSCNVWVHYDRAGVPGEMDGRILDLVSCDGPYGHWTGTMLAGGLDDGAGFVVPFASMPIDFTVGGSGMRSVQTSTSGVVSTSLNPVDVAWKIAITDDGTTMTYVATPDPPSDGITSNFPPMKIEQAPDGRCP